MECSSLAFVLASVVGSDRLLLYKAKKDVILPDYHNVDNRVKIWTRKKCNTNVDLEEMGIAR